MRSRGLFFGLAILVLFSFTATDTFANLKTEIAAQKEAAAVIVPYDGKAQNGYQLLILSRQAYKQSVGISGEVLENEYFKVVEDGSSTPLALGDFDGDNVLYHLMVARSYYARLAAQGGGDDPALNHKVTVRVRVDHIYNHVTHFGDRPSFNDARYIPASYVSNGKQWQSEIWFHRKKGELRHMDWKTLVASSGVSAALGGAALLPVTIPLDFYAHYNFGMDSAKMPNAIYHEAFHWATDTQGLFKMAACGDAMSENYANYFGSAMTGRPRLLEINEFSSKFYKRNYEKLKRVKNTKTSMYNYTSFVPALFWKIRDILGEDRADQVIWNSMSEFSGARQHAQLPAAITAAMRRDPSITIHETDQVKALLDSSVPSLKNLDKRFSL